MTKDNVFKIFPGVLVNDVSVIELNESVNLDPIGLASESAVTDETCQVLGWGITMRSTGGIIPNVPASSVLRNAQVTVQDHDRCADWYFRHNIILDADRHLCAGDEEGSTDACQGDSGSPLVCKRNSKWELVGIVSWGVGCGEVQLPGVYTNILQYKSWILNTMGVDQQSNHKAAGRPIARNTCSCGIQPQMRITNSNLAPVGHWPWFVLISKLNKSGQWKQMCGATLIDDRHALSAAHCFITEDFISGIGYVMPESYKFYLNFYHNGMSDQIVVRRASWIRCHEKYIQQKRGLYNDICLIRFEVDVPCNSLTRPICLATQIPTEKRQCLVAGFGDQTGLDQYASTLRQGILSIQNHEYCRVVYGSNDANVNESFFCAANHTHGIDTCQGDSGGPLTCDSEGIHYLFGITSFGVGCNDQHYPGAYTDVSHYRNWIDNTKSYKPCNNTPIACGAIIRDGPGVLTLQRDSTIGHYLNNQVIIIFQALTNKLEVFLKINRFYFYKIIMMDGLIHIIDRKNVSCFYIGDASV